MYENNFQSSNISTSTHFEPIRTRVIIKKKLYNSFRCVRVFAITATLELKKNCFFARILVIYSLVSEKEIL